MKEENNDIIKELIAKFLAGETSQEEEQQLHVWIDQTSENERFYLDFKKVFALSEKHYEQKNNELPDLNIDKEWNHFVNAINQTEKPVRKLQAYQASLPWLRMAAAILVLIVSGLVINYFIYKYKDVQFQTANNTLNVQLPDGSQVILNRRSELSYAQDFGEEKRTVILKGEAFFEVTHDKLKPFIIQPNGAAVEVLGTSFNVQAYDSVDAIEVIVETGIVKLSVAKLNEEVKLVAGQKGVYQKNNDKLIRNENKDLNYNAWNTRKIIFTDAELRAVIETLNKIYNTNITIASDIPASCVVTVTFDAQTLEAVLHVLENTLNLTYKINGNQIEITSAGC